VGRNGYRREYRQPDRSSVDRGGAGAEQSVWKGSYADHPARVGSQSQANGSFQVMVGALEKRMSVMQEDFTQALHKINEKENEKFDLIFAILSELQSRQAQLEESVRSLKTQYNGSSNTAHVTGNGHMVNGTGSGNMSPQSPQHSQQQQQPQPHQQQQQQQQQPQQQYGGASNGQQSYGQMGGHISGQQYAGVMQADSSQAMFTAVPQVVVVSSPAAAGMQYATPQMVMSPTGAMQPMPPQMAMQFLNQGSQMNGGHVWRRPDEDMGFVGSQDGSTTGNSNGQAVSVMVSSEASYWGEATHTPSTPHHQSAAGGNAGVGVAGTAATSPGGGSAVIEAATATGASLQQGNNQVNSGVNGGSVGSVQQHGTVE